MGPQVLGQALIGRVRLGREDQVGQLALQAAAGHGQAVPADLPCRVTVTQIQAGSEQLGHPTRKADGPARRGLVDRPDRRPWRDLPERFGNWNSVWRRFDRWAKKGTWQRLFAALQDPDLEWLILDSTIIRAHPHAAGAKKKRTGQGGKASKPWAAAEAGSEPRFTRRSVGWGCR
jgi:transposase